MEEEPSLWDVGRYIFTGRLQLEDEGDAFEYSSVCSLEGCTVEDVAVEA